MIKVAIADDHKIVTESLEQTFEDSTEQIEVVATAEDGKVLIHQLKKLEVDVVILDISMPSMDGVEALRWIKAHRPELKVLMLTMHNDSDRIIMCMQLQADGYLLKNRTGKDAVKALRVLMKGDHYFPNDIRDIVFDSHMPKEELKRLKLSEREEQVLILLAAGDRAQDIADKIFVSKSTVETHKKHLMEKLRARNVQDLVRFAVKNGYCRD